MRALIGVVVVGWICCPALAQETGRKWWHFGQGQEADVTVPPTSAQPQTATAPAATGAAPLDQPSALPQSSMPEEAETRWMISSPLAKVSWPRIQMPELPKPTIPATPWPKKSEANPNRNAWAEPDTTPLKPSPMQAMSSGARRVGQRTRAAWDKTIDALTPGEEPQSNGPSSRVARRRERPAWKRMFGSNEPQPKEGSQTIGEFIAQERIDP